VDEQAASESVMSIYNTFMAGSNLIHDVGCIDSGLNGSLSSLVMCDEIIGMIKQIGKGIKVDEENLALDVLKEVGPGGEFISHDHTFDHWKEWFRPTIIDRSNYERGLYVQAQVDCGCNCDCDKNIKVESDHTSVINPIADPGEIKKLINEEIRGE